MSIGRYLRHTGYFVCGLVLTGALSGAQISDAATYYVATTGSDTNSGTEAGPFLTINRGVQALSGGDTLFINSGVYAEELKNPLPSGLSATQPTKLTGPAANRPIIRPTTRNNGGFIILLNRDRAHITFENLVLDASSMPEPNSALATNSATIITNLVLQDCEAIGKAGAGSTGSAVTIGNNTQATVRRCSIHGWRSDTSNPGAHGLYWRGKNGLIEFNQMYDNNGYGLQFYSEGGGVDNNVFRNNYSHHNTRGGLYIGSGNANQAYNNIIVNNGWGIAVRGQNTKIFNNTVYHNTGNGVQVNSGVGAVIQNNIINNNGRNILNQSSSTIVDHNLTSDPEFVDPTTDNFELQAASPAIDAGATLSEVQDDYVKVPRPQGSGYDIGAYEYTRPKPAAPTGLRIVDAN